MQYRVIMLESKSINKTIICLVGYARFLVCFVPELGLCAVLCVCWGHVCVIMCWIMSLVYVVRMWGAPGTPKMSCVWCFVL